MDFTELLIKKEFEKIRPPEQIRQDVDLSYTFEKNTLIINEVRPRWDDPSEITTTPCLKARFIISKNIWNIYWMRSDLKWHSYNPNPEVKSIIDVFKILKDDDYGCFFG